MTSTHPGAPLFPWGLRLTLLTAYVSAFLIIWLAAGPGEAGRRVGAEGLILVLWLAAALPLLRQQSPETIRIERPRLELGLGLLVVLLGAVTVAARYAGLGWLAPVVGATIIGLPLLVWLLLGYDRRSFGLQWPPARAWLALLLVVGINIVIGQTLGRWLPPGELPEPPGADLSEGLESAIDVPFLIAQLLVVAALPEELFFRVYLQPRLERYLPVGWALALQAFLFSAMHLPQQILLHGESWPLALAGAVLVNNGLISGVFWRRTRSLPILLLLHLFAFPRFGL